MANANNFFNKLKEKQIDEPKKSLTKHPIVLFSGKDFTEALDEYAKVDDAIKKLEGQKAQVEGILKDKGRTHFINNLKKSPKRLESFIMTSDTKGSVMFTMKDAYTKLTEETHQQLTENYKGDFIEETTKWVVDNELFNKYQNEIAAFLQSKKIASEDSEKILKPVTEYSIKKGTIDRLPELAKTNNIDMATMMMAISPTVALRGAKKGDLDVKVIEMRTKALKKLTAEEISILNIDLSTF